VVLARMDSGMTAEQVVDAFETQYGQSVLMQPPRRGFNWTAYLMPFVGLGIGMGLLGMAMRRVVQRHRVDTAAAAGSPEVPVSVSPEDMANLKRELDKFEA
jgi:cytochrome c-type biogenesis protein CcmH/NrfF